MCASLNTDALRYDSPDLLTRAGLELVLQRPQLVDELSHLVPVPGDLGPEFRGFRFTHA